MEAGSNPGTAIHPLLARSLAFLVIVQLLRYGVFALSPGATWGAPVPVAGVDHACLAAYLRGAELAADVPDRVYDPSMYLVPAEGAPPRPLSRVRGLEAKLSDPYQYPPTFLPLPGLAVGLGLDFRLAHALAWILAMGAFTALVVWLTRAGDAGSRRARVLALGAVASFPVLQSFHFGQAHLLACAGGAAAYVAAERQQPRLAGFMLAGAVSAKLFPGIVVVPMLIQRRFRALAWAAGVTAGLAALSLALYGAEPFVGFVRDQLPALASGAAFAPFRDQPEFVVSNLGIGSLPAKLSLLAGGAGDAPTSTWLAVIHGLVTLGLAVVVGLRAPRGFSGAAAAMGLVTLASIAGAYVPAGYAMSAPMWLLALLVAARTPVGWRAWIVGGLWVFLAVQPFLLAMPVLWRQPVLLAAASIVALGLVLAAAGRAALLETRT